MVALEQVVSDAAVRQPETFSRLADAPEPGVVARVPGSPVKPVKPVKPVHREVPGGGEGRGHRGTPGRRTGTPLPEGRSPLPRFYLKPPRVVKLVLAFDVVLMGLFVLSRRLKDVPAVKDMMWYVDLDVEMNLPSWWSSMKFAAVGVLLMAFHFAQQVRQRPGSGWAKWAAIGCLGLSLDEMTQLHETLSGLLRDSFGDIKMLSLAFALPLLVGLVVIGKAAWRDLSQYRHVLYLVIAGWAVFILGFAVVDELGEFIERDTFLWRLEVLVEEGLEMIGVTLLIWACVSLHLTRGVRL